jgi:hypothetical protein
MTISYLSYELHEDFINNWLEVGPESRRIAEFELPLDEDAKRALSQQNYLETSGVSDLPVERGPLDEGRFTLGEYEDVWSYLRCREDHLVNHTTYQPAPHYLRSWAYAELVSDRAQRVTLELYVHGPADLWLNDAHIHHHQGFSETMPQRVPVEVSLEEGPNPLLVRFEQVGYRTSPHQMSVRLAKGLRGPEGIHVRIPTTIHDVDYRNKLEAFFAHAYLKQDIFYEEEPIRVFWREEVEAQYRITVRLETPPQQGDTSGKIYGEATGFVSAGDEVALRVADEIPEGPYVVTLMPGPRAYYNDETRIRRRLPLWNLGNRFYARVPQGTYTERRRQALFLAAQQERNIYAEIAKLALGQWSHFSSETIQATIREVERNDAASLPVLVGLLGMLYRYGQASEFPHDLKRAIKACVRHIDYTHPVLNDLTESETILLETARILVGQYFSDRQIGGGEKRGAWYRQEGESNALRWMRTRGNQGFKAWDAPDSFAGIILALAHLIDFAESESVWELASVTLDKALFTLAINAFEGNFGATHGAASTEQILGGLLKPTSGITRLLWGEGIFNHGIESVVSLACLENYEFPALIHDIATDRPAAVWDKERHLLKDEGNVDKASGDEINKVTYRTPDTMLGSAQDYLAGELGGSEHLWQASLGPEAVVFVNHPANAATGTDTAPNFWVGNGARPRIAQHGDVLIALYDLTRHDHRMPFTHAYFPLYAFDDYALRENSAGHVWAFAKKDDGYIGLTASQPLTLMERGPGAYRELRAQGDPCVWVCQTGRRAIDGTFDAFQTRLLELTMDLGDLGFHGSTLRDARVDFDWEGPLTVNGERIPITGFKHYENNYTIAELMTGEMLIGLDEMGMRLRFDRDLDRA